MRAERTAEAEAVSRRVREGITRQNNAWLRRVNTRQDARGAWEKVRDVIDRSAKSTMDAVEGITAQALNDHYADISHDREYQVTLKKQTASSHFTEEEVFPYSRSPETDSNWP